MNTIPRIAITPGEPAGIGPDLVVQLAQQSHHAELIAIADAEMLATRAETLGLPLRIEHVNPDAASSAHQAGSLKVFNVPLTMQSQYGQLNKQNAAYVLETLKQATQGCLQKQFDAMVTGPVHKGIINEAGIRFSGHTELLAELTHTEHVVMMLMTPGLKVALATTHLPLREISDTITEALLENVIRILDTDLKNKFGINHPDILVCGLNPHAGEDGHLGREDEDVVKPAIKKMLAENIRLTGPLPADTLFIPKYLDKTDAVLAMYHDQGLPVLKHKGFGNAVNVTLGLPIIRTSVDHGTALDLAGSGKADCGSLEMAIQIAIEMAQHAGTVQP